MCYKIEMQNKNAEKLNKKLDELNAPQFLKGYLNELESKSGALNYLVYISLQMNRLHGLYEPASQRMRTTLTETEPM